VSRERYRNADTAIGGRHSRCGQCGPLGTRQAVGAGDARDRGGQRIPGGVIYLEQRLPVFAELPVLAPATFDRLGSRRSVGLGPAP